MTRHPGPEGVPRTDPQSHLNPRTRPSPGVFSPRGQTSSHAGDTVQAVPVCSLPSELALTAPRGCGKHRDRTPPPWGAGLCPSGASVDQAAGACCDQTPPRGPGTLHWGHPASSLTGSWPLARSHHPPGGPCLPHFPALHAVAGSQGARLSVVALLCAREHLSQPAGAWDGDEPARPGSCGAE